MTTKERFKKLRLMTCCCGCSRPSPSDVAHSNAAIHGKGMAIKSNDEFTIPLNRICHAKFDQYNMGMSRDESLEWFNCKLESTNETLRRLHDKAIQNYPESF